MNKQPCQTTGIVVPDPLFYKKIKRNMQQYMTSAQALASVLNMWCLLCYSIIIQTLLYWLLQILLSHTKK